MHTRVYESVCVCACTRTHALTCVCMFACVRAQCVCAYRLIYNFDINVQYLEFARTIRQQSIHQSAVPTKFASAKLAFITHPCGGYFEDTLAVVVACFKRALVCEKSCKSAV